MAHSSAAGPSCGGAWRAVTPRRPASKIRAEGGIMDDALRDRAAVWYHREHFGFSKPPPQTDLRAMAIALVAASNGDRQITVEERNWIVGYFAAKGYPPDVVREAMSLAPPPDLKALRDLMEPANMRKNAR